MSNIPHLAQTSTEAEQIALIESLITVGTAMFSCKSLDDLLNLILSTSREITWSDAGSIYLVDRSDGILKLLFEVSQNSSQPTLSLRDFAIPINMNSLAGYVAMTGESLNWADVYNLPATAPYKLDHSFDKDTSYRTRSMLVLPMQNPRQETVGVIQLINRKVSPDAIVTPSTVEGVTQPYSRLEERIVRSLACQAAAAMELQKIQS
jgi:GAF domain-containing protein